MNEAEFDTVIIAELVDDPELWKNNPPPNPELEAPGKELARTHRTVHVIPEGAWTRQTVTVVLPPPLSPAETVTAFLPLPKWTWHKWLWAVGDAVHEGDRDAVQTLLDLGLRKGFA